MKIRLDSICIFSLLCQCFQKKFDRLLWIEYLFNFIENYGIFINYFSLLWTNKINWFYLYNSYGDIFLLSIKLFIYWYLYVYIYKSYFSSSYTIISCVHCSLEVANCSIENCLPHIKYSIGKNQAITFRFWLVFCNTGVNHASIMLPDASFHNRFRKNMSRPWHKISYRILDNASLVNYLMIYDLFFIYWSESVWLL